MNPRNRFRDSRLAGVAAAALLLVVTAGCRPASQPDPAGIANNNPAVPVMSEPLNILVVDAPEIGPVLSRQYSARNSGTVRVIDVAWAQLQDGNYEQLKTADVVIYPAMRVGEFAAAKRLQPLESADLQDAGSRRSILNFDREKLATWKDAAVGVSLGQTLPVLLVRRDVLETCSMPFPETWAAFSAIREELQRVERDGAIPETVAIPLADHWASYMLLVRAAASIRTQGRYSALFDVGDMRPLTATEPFLRALQGWAVDLASSRDDAVLAPAQVLAGFLKGEFAMAITIVHPKMLDTEITPNFEFVLGPIPGSREVFDFDSQTWSPRSDGQPFQIPLIGCNGMVASVTASTQRSRVAADFLSWLQDKQISAIIGLESASIGPSQKTHLASPGKWLGRSFTADNATAYSSYLQTVNDNRLCLTTLRIPAADKYLDVLDTVVREVVCGKANAVESLARVPRLWSELTRELGLEKQREAYRSSEGLSN
jgi:multiple sugar transport system substrate-binding protein